MKPSMKLFVMCLFLGSVSTLATILPKNNLHLQDRLFDSTMTEERFNDIIDSVTVVYEPIVSSFGANLVVDKDWEDPTVNAYANQSGKKWTVAMFGGLARRPEVTDDGFAMVVCHELGHHLAGYPFYGSDDWAASEGQSDYFASHTCAKRIWKNETEKNAEFKKSVDAFAKSKCDVSYTDPNEQNLCYRIAMAGKSLAKLLAALRTGAEPKFDTPDMNKVTKTKASHPAAQCRLDTYFAGSLCLKDGPVSLIPGKGDKDGNNSVNAEKTAFGYSCFDKPELSVRPRCWFKSIQ